MGEFANRDRMAYVFTSMGRAETGDGWLRGAVSCVQRDGALRRLLWGLAFCGLAPGLACGGTQSDSVGAEAGVVDVSVVGTEAGVVDVSVGEEHLLADGRAGLLDNDTPASDADRSFDSSASDGAIQACGSPVLPPASACPAALCGNGAIDNCTPAIPDAGAKVEQCDGMNLGSQTCESLGFAKGSLACRGNCSFDTHGCEGCAMGQRTIKCLQPDLGGAPESGWFLGLAASATEIGLAWLEGTPDQHRGAPSFHTPANGLDCPLRRRLLRSGNPGRESRYCVHAYWLDRYRRRSDSPA